MLADGLKSFHLDCYTNDDIAEIEGEFGITGFAVIVRLWQKIYGEKGYYCEWTKRSPVLFLSKWFGGNSGVGVNLISEIVNRAISIGIFDKRRTEVNIVEEYLLFSVAEIRSKQKNVCFFSVSANKKANSVCKNQQKKVNESKVNESKVNESKDVFCSELSNDSLKPQEVVISLSLNTGEEYPIYDEDIKKWQELYPSVDIMQALRNMKGWLMANPTRRKTKSGIKRFIVGWLSRQQNNGTNKTANTSSGTKNLFKNFGERNYTPEELESFAMGIMNT